MRTPRRLTTYALATVILPLLAASTVIAPLSFGHAIDRNFNLTEEQLTLLIIPTPLLLGILGISLSAMLPAHNQDQKTGRSRTGAAGVQPMTKE